MNKLREHRKAQGLSQFKLAVAAETQPVTISNIERGLRPSASIAQRLADALGVEVADLFPALEDAA